MQDHGDRTISGGVSSDSRWRSRVATLAGAVLVGLSATALADDDLRLATALGPTGTNELILRLSDCTDVASATLSAGTLSETLSVDGARRLDAGSASCELSLPIANAEVLDARAEITAGDGTVRSVAESFLKERNAPSIALEDVAVRADGAAQSLIVRMAASDDVDLTHLDLSLSAVRASDLRANGGIVERALESAFADSDGSVRLYPSRDDQRTFALSVPVTEPLADAEILSNGIVLIDALAVDASGNTASYSTITFTGDDVNEEALSLDVVPDTLLFTDLLESAVLVPEVEFEFRGPTTLAGAGRGVTYESSHPDLVAVSTAGVVYPLRDAAGTDVTVTVAYPGLDPVDVPITMDFSRRLSTLRADGPWTLPALNRPFEPPAIHAVGIGRTSGTAAEPSKR